jgi:hypothetical protein
VSDNKKIREIVGLTFEAQKANSEIWIGLARSFNSAACILDRFSDQIPSDLRPFVFNCALSLELAFKAILVRRGRVFPTGPSGHDLIALCNAAEVEVSDDQKTTLELMTAELVWAARYPTPKSVDEFDRFHDVIFEKHKVRHTSGNMGSVIANPKIFPTLENCLQIWNAALFVYETIESCATPPSHSATS